jgi:prevent-host-death family protein
MTAPRRISIRELHERTGTLVREAAAARYVVVVTDRGRPVATLAPYVERDGHRTFRDRVLLPEFAAFKRRIAGDSSVGIADDRSRV